MDPVAIGVIVAFALFLLSGITVAHFKGGTWTVRKVVMGVPVEWVFHSSSRWPEDDGK